MQKNLVENMDSTQQKKAKHFKEDKKNLKIAIVGISVIIVIFIAILWQYKFAQKLKPEPMQNEIIEQNVLVDNSGTEFEEKLADEIVDVSDMPDKIHGYKVVGKIVIDKINISSYILGETSDDSLKYAATKYWGPRINEAGNYCITAHNYKSIFGYIHTLDVGDTFYLVGKDGRKVTYTVTEILPSVKPNDFSHVAQVADNKRKVTLITCTSSGLARVIVKAEEKI